MRTPETCDEFNTFLFAVKCVRLLDLLHSEMLDLGNLNHKALSFDLTLFWRCQNVPLLAKGEGRRRATG